MRVRHLALSAALLTLWTADLAHAHTHVLKEKVLGFDDVGLTNYYQIFDSGQRYNYLYFSGFFPTDVSGPLGGSEAAGIISQPDAILGGDLSYLSAIANPRTPFDLNNAYFTAAYRDGQEYTVNGIRGTSKVYTETITLSTDGPTKITFDWTNLNAVSFYPVVGTATADPYGCGRACPYSFVMDNLDVDVVPEPASWMMSIAGIAGIGILARRRRKSFASVLC
jgi:hypothetical protein